MNRRQQYDESTGVQQIEYPTFRNGTKLKVYQAFSSHTRRELGLDVAIVLTGKVRDFYWPSEWDC